MNSLNRYSHAHDVPSNEIVNITLNQTLVILRNRRRPKGKIMSGTFRMMATRQFKPNPRIKGGYLRRFIDVNKAIDGKTRDFWMER